jgi:hypothetical protein
MAVDNAPAPNGLKTAWDIIVAPKAAFESIRAVPTWGWAVLITIVVGSICSYLMTPAMMHAYAGTFAHQAATDPRISSLSPEDQQRTLAIGTKAVAFTWMFVIVFVPIFAVIGAAVLLLFDKIGGGQGTFGKYWAAACNIAIPSYALAVIVSALIVFVRGADSFGSMQEVQAAVPSLAMLAPGAGLKLVAFLGTITPFTLWGAYLNVMAMRIIGNTRPVPAWIGALLILVLPGLLASAGAR